MAARRRILFICFVNVLVFSKFDDLLKYYCGTT